MNFKDMYNDPGQGINQDVVNDESWRVRRASIKVVHDLIIY